MTATNISEYIQHLENCYSVYAGKKHLFFRGHADKENFKLLPTVLRPSENYREREVLLDFKQYAPAHNIKYNFVDERGKMLADMQHHGIPTRLLDWTVAPLNALFFCCENLHDKDGEIIIFNPWDYWVEIVREKNVEEIHQINIEARALLSDKWSFARIKKYIQKKFNYVGLIEEDIEYPFAYVANYTNSRIIHQRGCFTIHGTDANPFNHDNKFDKYFKTIKIPSTSKLSIIDELSKLYINEYSIYPDFEGMGKLIKRKKGLFNI